MSALPSRGEAVGYGGGRRAATSKASAGKLRRASIGPTGRDWTNRRGSDTSDRQGGTYPGGNTGYLDRKEYLGSTNSFICRSDRTYGSIPIDLGWEYFGYATSNHFTTSYAYHLGPWQQTTTDGKVWLTDQLSRWKARFIVAACPWHRHLYSGWSGAAAPSIWQSTKIKDVALRYDSSVDSFRWPSTDWESEPYLTTR